MALFPDPSSLCKSLSITCAGIGWELGRSVTSFAKSEVGSPVYGPRLEARADCPSMIAYQQQMQVAAVAGPRPQLNVAPFQARQSSRIKIESPSVNAAKKSTSPVGTASGDSPNAPSTPTDSGDDKPCSKGISVHLEADLSPSKSKL